MQARHTQDPLCHPTFHLILVVYSSHSLFCLWLPRPVCVVWCGLCGMIRLANEIVKLGSTDLDWPVGQYIFCRQGMCQTSMMNMATTEKGRPISYKRPYFSDSQISPRLKFANLLVGDPFVPGLCFQLQKLTLPIANAATKMLFHGHMCDHRVSQLDAVAYGGPRYTYYI